MSSQEQPAALAEGRRIYLGNLLYSVQPEEVEQMLQENGFQGYEKIHISIDPVSSRNPGYCFVDFAERADADRALSSLEVSLRGRQVKVGPCEPKKQRTSRWGSSGTRDSESNFNRWGNWTGQREPEGRERGEAAATRHAITEQGPYGAIEHFDRVVDTDTDGRRLYVGGLGQMVDQEQNQAEVAQIFEGFNPIVIGKRITPHEATRSKPGNYHYCFVDFGTVEEAAQAMKALDGKLWQGELLRVRVANPIPQKLQERGPSGVDRSPGRDNTVWRERTPRNGGGEDRSREGGQARGPRKSDQPLKSLASMDWRRRDPPAA
ncbi:RNA recognition domain-containing protein [Colletotrichum plurivorum]|uniref:RNA recognition domain-containing protein n=1 Tax=Colletotrichum plurivorum TaxID=2175906 RepID=A0A8H6JMN1_9PEZI|nr:RNA recognition domain-containing protein [Colletotrichum plurivorum]